MIIMNDEWQVLPDKARRGARGRLAVLRHERFVSDVDNAHHEGRDNHCDNPDCFLL